MTGLGVFAAWEAWKHGLLSWAKYPVTPGHFYQLSFAYSGAGVGGAFSAAQAQSLLDALMPAVWSVYTCQDDTPARRKAITIGAVYAGPAPTTAQASQLVNGWPPPYGAIQLLGIDDMGAPPPVPAS